MLAVLRRPLLQGYDEVWSAEQTVLTCVPARRDTGQRATIIAAVVASAAVLAVALAVWMQYLRTRPRWLRERILQVRVTGIVVLYLPTLPAGLAASSHCT